MHEVRTLPAVALAIVFTVSTASVPVRSEPFPTQCSMPQAASGKARKVDQQCGLGGVFDTDAHRAQNAAKNNFCSVGTPIDLTRDDFERLQAAAEQSGVEFGARDRLPADRGLLRQILPLPNGARIGEGSLVRHVGFLSHPRPSNVEHGESVNCNFAGEPNNDVHFDLVQDTGDDACSSVTGEITPHRRAPHYEVTVLRLHRVSERPLRVTGQLFFDASHRPCRNGEPQENLKRISLWEIHPVYTVDVCRRTTIADCQVTNESVWIPLDRFVNLPQEEHGDAN